MKNLPLPLLLILLLTSVTAQAQFSVFEASIADINQALNTGQVTSEELVQQYLARIEAYDKQGPALNSIVRINPEALRQARALDRERQSTGPRSALHGIPILVKDNYNVAGMATSGGSVALADFQPAANATQIQKLLDAGAIVLAKTNLHEYAYGITTVGSLFGQTRNPYDIRRVPGGSSGGTGAAVAANFAAIGLGSDTCGSIRIPSSFNNLIGLRPSKGLSSIFGVMPLSHTQDVAGPLARSAADLAILLDIVSGYDANDAATRLMQNRGGPQFVQNLDQAVVSQLRLGRLEIYFDDSAAAVRQATGAALDWFESQGAEVVEVSIPDVGELLGASGLITQEFQTDLNEFLATFGSTEMTSLADILAGGLYHSAVSGPLQRSAEVELDAGQYQARMDARQTLRQAILRSMDEHQLDAIVYPSIAQLPTQIGDPQTGSHCSLSANSGLPALSMPVGFTANGLPVGLELLGVELADAALLSIAYAYEQANSPRNPPSSTPPLEQGQAPAPELLALTVAELSLDAVFEFDVLSNSLGYTLAIAEPDQANVHAVVLAIDAAAGSEREGQIVHNLLAPEMDSVTGSYFMSEEFRQAFASQRVSLRIFAAGLPVNGMTVPLQE